jgi:glycosyltransferase involved in cell wall biosynthesis
MQIQVSPLVSVIITVRNAEAFISETLASILQERTIPIEIVLVDNGCTDATIAKAQALNDNRIQVVQGPRKGISHALNVGYKAARGEIIMRCDGDDLFPPTRITRQVEWLNAHPEFGAVCGGFSTIDVKSALLADLGRDTDVQEITEELRNGKTRTHIGTFAMRAEAVKASGYSREYFDCFEDIDFQLRLGEACRVGYIAETEYFYRLHSTSVTHSQSNTLREFYDATALEFQQQRRTRGEDDLQRGCPPAIPQKGDKAGMNASEHVQEMLLQSAWTEHQAGHKQRALSFGFRSVMTQPMKLSGWRSLFALLVKPAGRSLKASSRA